MNWTNTVASTANILRQKFQTVLNVLHLTASVWFKKWRRTKKDTTIPYAIRNNSNIKLKIQFTCFLWISIKMNFFFFSTLIIAVIFAFASAGTIGNGPVNATTTGTCGGNCPGNGCGSCPCGTTTNPADITHWCAQYSGWNQVSFEFKFQIIVLTFWQFLFLI